MTWYTPRADRFTPGIGPRYPLYRTVGENKGRLEGYGENLLPARGIEIRIVHPIVQSAPEVKFNYTDYDCEQLVCWTLCIVFNVNRT
jgi:hypothetical protein